MTEPRRRAGVSIGLLIGLVAVAVGGYIWSVRGWPREHDRHALRSEFARVESAVRGAHHYQDWTYVERVLDQTEEAARHPEHLAILEQLDRLAHVQDLVFADVKVSVDGDRGVAAWRVGGRAKRGDPPAPSAGEMRFERRGGRWVLAAIVLREPSVAPGR